MAATMVYRGPDDEGIYTDPEFGLSLGARRLAIIDPEGGRQPVCNEDRSVWAVLNGEIYNHHSLRKHLRASGHQLASHTDTEVLVHLYEEYGDALVHALEGMYAFAVWDGRRRRLLIARDRFGEKPLFYRQQGSQFAFASELGALEKADGADLSIDPEALDAYFVLGYFPGSRTVYASVRQLLPGSLLRWSAEDPQPREEKYWALPSAPSTTRSSLDDLVEECAELLRASVRSRLVADVPVGVFLSGGLDSTVVAALAAEEAGERLKTFTVGYDTAGADELEPARAVARALGAEHTEVVLRSGELAQRVVRVIGSLDQPNADPALLALHALAEAAKPRVTVGVGGEGADELFAGYPRYRWIARAMALEQVFPQRLAWQAAQVLASASLPQLARVGDVLWPGTLAARNLDWMTFGRREARQALYGPRLREVALGEHALLDAASVLEQVEGHDIPGSLMELDRRRYLPDDVLAKADRATMLASLEMRTPYLNRQLAEFARSVPTQVHLGNGGKALLRAVADRLPNSRISPPAKRAFTVPMVQWLRDALKPLLEQQTTEGRLVREGWIAEDGLRALVSQHLAGESDHSQVLWPVVTAGLWLDQRLVR